MPRQILLDSDWLLHRNTWNSQTGERTYSTWEPKGKCLDLILFLYMFLCLWEGKAEGVWQGWLWFFLSAALGRKLHFHSLSLFQKQLPPPRSATWKLSSCWGLKCSCARGLAPQTVWNYLAQTAKWTSREISGNCTKLRSYILPVSTTCLNSLSKF